jgi:hypothetical protein
VAAIEVDLLTAESTRLAQAARLTVQKSKPGEQSMLTESLTFRMNPQVQMNPDALLLA